MQPPKFIKKNGVNRLNPAYLEWKKETGSGVVQTKQHEAPIDEMIVSLKIIQGTGLVAKDRNLLGKKTTSDPFVQVALMSGGRQQHKLLGQTTTIRKNLSPEWNYTLETKIKWIGNANSQLVFRIFDEDKLSEPDNMGVVTVPVVWKDSNTTQWYEVPKNSAKNASGKIQLQIQTKVYRLEGFQPYV